VLDLVATTPLAISSAAFVAAVIVFGNITFK
jgi:hypothetical protein